MPEPYDGELPVEAARARMLEGVAPAAAETVTLAEALGRTLAAPVVATRDQPATAVSAMDGWAVAAEPGLEPLAVIGESAAGRPFGGSVEPGEAVRIFTGAALPPGTRRVIVQERSRREGDRVAFEPHTASSDHVRPAGGDFRAGEALLAAGVRLDAWRIALAAAAGCGSVPVAPRPRIAILSTGEEIVPAGAPLAPHQIPDSNGPALAALVRGWGGQPLTLQPAGDDEAAIAAAVQGVGAELIVTVGGASVGDHDLVKAALRRLGLRLVVDTVRMRPGKPTWFGRLEDGRRVLGLPGNPASALVCAVLFLRPLVLALQGADPTALMGAARLAVPLPANGPREHWMRTRLATAADDALEAKPASDQDSSRVAVLAAAEALLRRPSDAPAAVAGERVDVLRLERLA